MSFVAASYIIALICDAFLIFLSVYHVIAFDELKTDFKNPIDHCNNLNPLILPEYAIHTFMTLFFLLCGEWISFFFNLPILVYNIHRLYGAMSRLPASKTYAEKLMSGLYDPTTIMNSDKLSKATKEGWTKLFFFLFSFFFYIYGLITTLVAAS